MDFAEEGSLASFLARRAREMNQEKSCLSLEELESLLPQLALALGEVHNRGILHADVKLENFLVKRRNVSD